MKKIFRRFSLVPVLLAFLAAGGAAKRIIRPWSNPEYRAGAIGSIVQVKVLLVGFGALVLRQRDLRRSMQSAG